MPFLISKGLLLFMVVCYSIAFQSLWRGCLCACRASQQFDRFKNLEETKPRFDDVVVVVEVWL